MVRGVSGVLGALDTALQTDLPWVREHTRLGELARHWDEEGRSKSATLRGADLEAAARTCGGAQRSAADDSLRDLL